MLAIYLTRYVSVGSLAGAIVAGTVVVVQALLGYAPTAFLAYGTLMSVFVIVAHRDNIQRLMNGTERKLSRGSRETAT